jgi:hypothetical protein
MSTDTGDTMTARKRAAPKAAVPTGPEPLIRLAFKEGDLRTIIDFMAEHKAGNDPHVAQHYHRLMMRLSEFQAKHLRKAEAAART